MLANRFYPNRWIFFTLWFTIINFTFVFTLQFFTLIMYLWLFKILNIAMILGNSNQWNTYIMLFLQSLCKNIVNQCKNHIHNKSMRKSHKSMWKLRTYVIANPIIYPYVTQQYKTSQWCEHNGNSITKHNETYFRYMQISLQISPHTILLTLAIYLRTLCLYI